MSSVLAGLRRFGSDGTDGQLTLMLWSEEAHYCRTKGGWHARRPSCHPFARPHTDPTGGLRPEPSIGLEIHIFGVHFPSRRERVRERKLSQGYHRALTGTMRPTHTEAARARCCVRREREPARYECVCV